MSSTGSLPAGTPTLGLGQQQKHLGVLALGKGLLVLVGVVMGVVVVAVVMGVLSPS
jgi:hypothetical protein